MNWTPLLKTGIGGRIYESTGKWKRGSLRFQPEHSQRGRGQGSKGCREEDKTEQSVEEERNKQQNPTSQGGNVQAA
jgi:hypothetical protein